MLAKTGLWKLQDAKARFSELVRLARAGEPQTVTVHGKEGVVVVDPAHFDITPKPAVTRTLRRFIERSKKYRGAGDGVDFEHRIPMLIDPRPVFDEDGK